MAVGDLPLYSITTTDFELANPQHVKWLAAVAADVAADVLVIDTVSGALPGVNENDAEAMTVPAAHLRALANTGLTVFALHHPPKNDPDGSRGSSVLPNKADRVYSIARRDDLLTLKPGKQREAAAAELTLHMAIENDPATGALLGVNFFDGQAARRSAEDNAVAQAILDALDGGPLNTRGLYRAVKVRREVVNRVLESLLRIGQVKVTDGPNRQKIYDRP
jgi:hypothetical protein